MVKAHSPLNPPMLGDFEMFVPPKVWLTPRYANGGLGGRNYPLVTTYSPLNPPMLGDFEICVPPKVGGLGGQNHTLVKQRWNSNKELRS